MIEKELAAVDQRPEQVLYHLGFFVFLHFFLLLEELLDSQLDLLKGNYHFHKSYKD
jgi:hypothetical protein